MNLSRQSQKAMSSHDIYLMETKHPGTFHRLQLTSSLKETEIDVGYVKEPIDLKLTTSSLYQEEANAFCLIFKYSVHGAIGPSQITFCIRTAILEGIP